MYSVSEFTKALRKTPQPADSILSFLRHHANAPQRAATVTQLSKISGWNGYRGVNLHYGILAKEIGLSIGEPNSNIGLLCKLIAPRKLTNTDWIVIMRDEFAEALMNAHWI